MKNKTIKQHYVPQCYIRNWAITNTNSVYVFDKEMKLKRKNNIKNIAEEKFFYDIDFSKIIREDEKEIFGIDKNIDLSKIDDEQYLENFFATNIEPHFKQLLNKLTVNSFENKESYKNQYFFTKKEKKIFSYYLIIQKIRVKQVRNSFLDLSDMLQQVFKDTSISTEIDKIININNSCLSYIHGKMILDSREINKLVRCIFSKKWFLIVNKTNKLFYTSDNPIGTIAHVKHPFMSMSGLCSEGVEAYFPVSPRIILVMVDRNFFKNIKIRDRKIIYTNDVECVNIYNRYIALNSQRIIISNDNDFEIIEEMLQKEENIFEIPKSEIHYNGKIFYPSKKSN